MYSHVVGELLQQYRVVYVTRRTDSMKPPGWWDTSAFFSGESMRYPFIPSKGDPTKPFGQAWNDLYLKMEEAPRCIVRIALDTDAAPDARHGVKVEFSRVGFDSTRSLGLFEVTLTTSRVPTLGGVYSEVRIVHVAPDGITSEIYAQLYS